MNENVYLTLSRLRTRCVRVLSRRSFIQIRAVFTVGDMMYPSDPTDVKPSPFVCRGSIRSHNSSREIEVGAATSLLARAAAASTSRKRRIGVYMLQFSIRPIFAAVARCHGYSVVRPPRFTLLRGLKLLRASRERVRDCRAREVGFW